MKTSTKVGMWCAPLFGALFATSAWAESWEGNIGLGVITAPDYLGSDDYRTRVWPALRASYGESLTISPDRGIQWHAIRQGNWRLSPFIGYTFGRDDRGDLDAFDKVRGGATLGLRADYTEGMTTLSLSGQSAVTGDVKGAEYEAAASLRLPISQRLVASVTPSITYANGAWTDAYFSVSEQDSARSGVAAYHTDGGYWRFGVSGSLTYALANDWSVTGFVGTSYLTGEAADSPIVDDLGSDWQSIAGASLNYRF
ncbi:MipA/OmpV family protein [Halomonas dongshanensis]|uniref:MipA/OmpV family protein n=1 Tax=Halomonas dongshanensis TaxID=2890835 RepID=A0ABT2EBD5_9GAMM|nr:MipA/OmpV family protein [Halomonas dongshanensis]MCS2608893.1 MipA/OmpV family protein [Halomonas dongshanensis]